MEARVSLPQLNYYTAAMPGILSYNMLAKLIRLYYPCTGTGRYVRTIMATVWDNSVSGSIVCAGVCVYECQVDKKAKFRKKIELGR